MEPRLDAYGNVNPRSLFFCGDPTADADTAAIALRVWYEANCPELHLDGWRGALRRGIRRVLFGYRDYDVDRDRHSFMVGLGTQADIIRAEQDRQLAAMKRRT